MQPYTDVLFSTSGPVRNVSVTVKTYPGGAVATIYSDNGVTPAANPVITGNDGRFLFYAADGFYTITVSGAGITTATIGPILLQDYSTTTPVASKLAASSGSSLVGGTWFGGAIATVAALATSIGSSLLGFIQAGVGAVMRSIQGKLRDVVSVNDFGAAGDGVTDDTAAFLAAATSLGPLGGTVTYRNKHLIDNNLTIPANVTIQGPMALVGTPGINTSAPYGNMAALIVNSAKTITLSSGAGLQACLLYREGMTFPAADSSAFAGTAITSAGDDVFLLGSMCLGFNQAFTSTNFQRPHIQNFFFDCLGGLNVVNCLDLTRISNCHGWPFATIASLGADSTLQRSGTAYRFQTAGDWNKATDCFSYGYLHGFWITNCNSMTLQGCGTDSTSSAFANQIGFLVDGGSTDTRLVLCQAAAQGDRGYNISTTAGLHTRLIGCDNWACVNHGIIVDAGDVTIIGGVTRNVSSGITTNNTASRIFIDKVRFQTNGVQINNNVNSTLVFLGNGNDYGNQGAGGSAVGGAGTFKAQSLVAADPLNLPVSGEIFDVTGNTNFGTLNRGWYGRSVTLFFAGTPTVFNGAGAQAMRLNGGGNFVAAAGSTLSLAHDGTQWYETGRSA